MPAIPCGILQVKPTLIKKMKLINLQLIEAVHKLFSYLNSKAELLPYLLKKSTYIPSKTCNFLKLLSTTSITSTFSIILCIVVTAHRNR